MEKKYNTRSPAVKRLMREAQELKEATYDYFAQPLCDNLFEWHFTVRGPADTEFDGGIYHGRIVLPPDYPMKPPNIIVLTPNGRFETGKKICLSISGHHPESWQPSWSIRTALLAIIGFMPTPGQGTIGSLDYSADERKKLARRSAQFKCEDCGGLTVDLLQNRLDKESTASAEAKEIIKNISFKSEEEVLAKRKPGAEGTEESAEDKFKRERKAASLRIQQRYRDKLYGKTSKVGNQVSVAPTAPSETASRSEPASTAAPQETPPPVPELSQHNEVRSQDTTQQHQDHGRHHCYDWIIAFVVLAIAALLYRRFHMVPGESEQVGGTDL